MLHQCPLHHSIMLSSHSTFVLPEDLCDGVLVGIAGRQRLDEILDHQGRVPLRGPGWWTIRAVTRQQERRRNRGRRQCHETGLHLGALAGGQADREEREQAGRPRRDAHR
jgi:hypothetical protein